MIVTEKLIVELEFDVEHEFTNEIRMRLAKRVAWVLVNCGAPTGIGLCPEKAEGFTESATVSAADGSEHKVKYEDVLP